MMVKPVWTLGGACPLQGGHSSVYAVLPNHLQALGPPEPEPFLFEVLNLVRAGIEANNLDLRLLASLLTPVAVPSGGEQVG
jgi:hypothetical protein